MDALQALRSSRLRISDQDDPASQFSRLLERRDKLQAKTDQLLQQGRRWPRLAAERTSLEDQSAVLEEATRRSEAEARTAEIALQVRDHWLARRLLDEELTQFGPTIDLPRRLSSGSPRSGRV